MSDLNKVGDGYKPPSPEVQQALDMPIEQLEAQIRATENSANEVKPDVNPQTQTVTATPQTIPVTSGQVAQVEVNKQVEQPVVVVETTPKVETPVTFADLQAKTGVKSPDMLAKNYTEVVKEMQRMKQAEAEKRRMEQNFQVQQPAIPQVTSPETNQNLLNQLLENPEMTLAQAFLKMNEVANAPYREKNAILERSLKFQEMANSPETADFIDPEIQEGMINEFKTRPDWSQSQESVNAHTEDAYWIARGKVKMKAEMKALEEGRRQGEQSIQQKKAGSVESAGSVSTPSTIQDNNPNTMPLADLEKLVLNKLQG